MTTLLANNRGNTIEISDEGELLMNGRLPEQIIDHGNGFMTAVSTFVRAKNPKRARSMRKRKKALMQSYRKYRFSFNFQLSD